MTVQTAVLIGITGRLGVGKSTLAGLIAEAIPDAQVVAFADKLKTNVHAMLSRDLLKFSRLDRASWEELKAECLGPIYQGYGELVRRLYGDDAWITDLALECPDRAIVADVRYPNEAEWIKSRGGLLVAVRGQCRRDGDQRSTDHPSERYVEEIARSAHVLVINDSDLDWLGAEARRIARAALVGAERGSAP